MKLACLAHFNDWSLRVRWALVMAIILVWAFVYVPVYDSVGERAIALTGIPVAVAGLLMGVRIGLLSLVLTGSILGLLHHCLGIFRWDTLPLHWPRIMVGLSIALATGYSSDLLKRVREKSRELECQREAFKEEIVRRRQMEQDLLDSEHRYRALSESSEDFIFIIGKKGNIEYANSFALDAFGFSKEEMIGKNAKDVFLGEIYEPQENIIRRVIESGKSLKTAGEVPLPHGKVWMDHCLIPLSSESGGMKSVLSISRDISRQKLTEEDLEKLVRKRTEQVSELERQRIEIERLAAAGLVAAQIAHEINNPLAGIKNSFLLIKDAIPKDHAYYEYAGRIEKEIDRIATIVRQMFNLYQPNQTRNEFPLDRTIYDVISLLEVSWREKGVTVDVEAESTILDLPEGSLRQVIYNLSLNAIDASPQGGIVKVETKVDEGILFLSISDQGPGIPEEARLHVFDPFFTTKHNSKGGLGLGLSISKGIIEAMGGRIDFETEAGKGTVFKITVPGGKVEKERRDA